MAARVLGLWVVSTLGWWAFAFTPLPSAPPAWLSAARHACFGSAETGLPAAHGWMLLVLGPLSFLIGIVVLWGADLPASLARTLRGGSGKAVVAVLALAIAVEGYWVVGKIQTAWAAGAWARSMQDEGELPADYVRQSTPARDFSLVDQHGRSISLHAFRGQPVVLAFVYAHCQTLCPLIVETLKQASQNGEPTAVLLVTLDPWRDTPTALPDIAARWNLPAGFHVLSARRVEDVVHVAERYGVAFTRDERTGEIVHPAMVFLVDADGRLAYTFLSPSLRWMREGVRRLGRANALAG